MRHDPRVPGPDALPPLPPKWSGVLSLPDHLAGIQPGTVVATPPGDRAGTWVYEPDPTREDHGDPHPWQQLWPRVEGPGRWLRTRDLPSGVLVAVANGRRSAPDVLR